jgi:type IV pilus assembly protein PilV
MKPTVHIPCRVRQAKPRRHGARAGGFALIEILVALLLFAIGILGLVGLQASMTQVQTDSKVRADAANLVDELSALMWSDLGKPAVLANLADYSAAGCAGHARCGPWLTKLTSALPGGRLVGLSFDNTASTTAATHGEVTVEVEWSMPNSGTHSYSATFNVAATGTP